MTTATREAPTASGLSLTDLIPEWTRHLRSTNKSADTIDLYTKEVIKLTRWLTEQGMSTDVGLVRREHLEAYIVAMQDRGLAEATISLSYRSLAPYFKWLVSTDEITSSPFAKMTPPKVHVEAKPFPETVEVEALLATCTTKDYEDLRDRAIITLLYDTGIRRGELVNLRVQDVDVTPAYPAGDKTVYPTLSVIGKARRHRRVVLNETARMAMKRYLAKRALHPHADLPALWLGTRGALQGGGVLQMFRRRGRLIGMPKLGPHQLRHKFAHDAMEAGMSEGDIMHVAGWSTASMLRRYGAAQAEQRALDAHARFSAGNRLKTR